MKIRTLSDLNDILDEEFAWRLKELADLKFIAQSSPSTKESSAIRAGLPLAYAHWEGFVKASAQYYLNFVLMQKIDLGKLQTCFIALSSRNLLNKFSESNRTFLYHELVTHLTSESVLMAPANYSTLINTRANLNSSVFTDISTSVGISPKSYETKFKFIDESLLKRRNEIAHGNYLDIDATSFRQIVDEVIGLLRLFKNDILNTASTKAYLK